MASWNSGFICAIVSLDAKLDQIVNSTVPDDALKNEMPALGPAVVGLGLLFASLAPETGLQVDAKGKVFGAFSRTGKNHPLVRAAMAMLRFQQKLGGVLAPEQLDFNKFCDAIPLFHAALQNFRKNMPPNF